MDQRHEFVRLALQEGANRRELCRRFNISPDIGYKWHDHQFLARQWLLQRLPGAGAFLYAPLGHAFNPKLECGNTRPSHSSCPNSYRTWIDSPWECDTDRTSMG